MATLNHIKALKIISNYNVSLRFLKPFGIKISLRVICFIFFLFNVIGKCQTVHALMVKFSLLNRNKTSSKTSRKNFQGIMVAI